MTARGKLWLFTFILGFALGILVFYFVQRTPRRSEISMPAGKSAYQIEPLLQTPIEGTDLHEFTQTAHQMGTKVNLKAHAGDKATVARAFTAAFDRIHAIELMMSPYRPRSPVSMINDFGRAKGYAVPEELGMVVAKSLEFCRLTRGALDITVGPLLAVYASAVAEGHPPREVDISKALLRVGYSNVSVSGDLRILTIANDGMILDLSATAKGYAADEAARVLKQNGVVNAFVEAGGDIRFAGPRGDGSPWKTGIQDPAGKLGDLRHILSLERGAVCTSGNYAQGYWLGGQRVSHILDPRTGKPCDNTPSVTVIAPNALMADAMATALSVLGTDGLRIVEKMPGVEALVITATGDKLEEHSSSGFAGLLSD